MSKGSVAFSVYVPGSPKILQTGQVKLDSGRMQLYWSISDGELNGKFANRSRNSGQTLLSDWGSGQTGWDQAVRSAFLGVRIWRTWAQEVRDRSSALPSQRC